MEFRTITSDGTWTLEPGKRDKNAYSLAHFWHDSKMAKLYTHTHTHTHTHTQASMHVCTYTHVHTSSHTHAPIHKCIQRHNRKHIIIQFNLIIYKQAFIFSLYAGCQDAKTGSLLYLKRTLRLRILNNIILWKAKNCKEWRKLVAKSPVMFQQSARRWDWWRWISTILTGVEK